MIKDVECQEREEAVIDKIKDGRFIHNFQLLRQETEENNHTETEIFFNVFLATIFVGGI